MLGSKRWSARWLRARCALALLAGVLGCADAQGGDEVERELLESEHDEVDLRAESATGPYRGLSRARREVLAEGIAGAENLLFVGDGVLLASGDRGIYAVTRGEGGKLASTPLHSGESCKFGGMAQVGEVVYANCYGTISSALFGASTSDLRFSKVSGLRGVMLANGLASDGQGHLFVSATGQSKIVRLTVSGERPALQAQEVWRSGTGGLLPNGLKVYDGALYWSDALLGGIRRVALATPTGAAAQLASGLIFDDISVSADGILVADYSGGTVRAYDLAGRRIAQGPSGLKGPSSVLPALGRLGLGPRDLVVTEKGPGLVSVIRLE